MAKTCYDDGFTFPRRKPMRGLTADVSTIQGYKDSLKASYSSELPPGSKWPAMGSNKCIEVVIYEKRKLDEVEENRITNVAGELEKFSELKRVKVTQVGVDESGNHYPVCIITGAPGVGKSCYVWSLARKWKDKELFTAYELAIVLRLSHPYVRRAKKLVDLIQYEIKKLRERAHNWIIKKNGNGCLILLDGFDELPDDLQRDSIMKQLISGETLEGASVIITTRSTAAKRLYNICNRRKCQFLEILGFDKQQIDNYILSAFNTDAKSIKLFYNYLQCYPNIRSFMCIPLHCAIVVQIFKSQQLKREPPKTMTELYTEVVKVFIIRSLQWDYPHLTDKGLDNLTDLPEEVLTCLGKIAYIGYDALLSDKLFFKIDMQIKKLDLLEEQPDIYDLWPTSVYNFVHKTIQEYLAAYHISTLSLEKQANILQEELCSSRMEIVLKFVAGLTKFSQLINDHVFNTDDIHALVQCIHCLFETQDPDCIRKALETNTKFDFTLQTLSPHDCYALNYCIVVSKVQIDLRLESSNITDEALAMLLHPIADGKCVFFYVKELVMTKNSVVKSRISDICTSLMKNCCLTSLWIEECDIDAKGIECFKKLLLQTQCLKRLVLDANPIRDQGAKFLGAGLKENHSIHYMSIQNCSFGHIGLTTISEALVHNKTLIELNIDGNRIGNCGVKLLYDMFKGGFSLKKLLLHRCIINPDDQCILHLKALNEMEDFRICIDHTIEISLQISNTQHEPEKDSIEPETRNAGCGVIVGEKLFVWGGQTERVGGMRYLPCSESHPFDVFDFTTKMWSHQPTSGDVPELGIGSSLIAYCGWLYLYGGLTEYEENVFAGDIYKVSMDTFQWKIIAIPPACKTTIKPSPRYTAGIILHDDRLCMFGGVGPKIVEDQDPGAEWVKAVNRDKGAFGWNNEYYEFDLKAECWSATLEKDAYRPKPIGSFSFCKYSCHKAILFGGCGSEENGCTYSDRMHHFDLEKHVWTRPVKKHSLPWPIGCRFHSMSALFDPQCKAVACEEPRWMVLLWGKISKLTISKDAWALNVDTWTWKKLQLCESLKPRAWHIACTNAQRDIVVFGGNLVEEYPQRGAVANLCIIPFDQILKVE